MRIKARPDNTYKSEANKALPVETRLARVGDAPQMKKLVPCKSGYRTECRGGRRESHKLAARVTDGDE